jgi:hypothetical protein
VNPAVEGRVLVRQIAMGGALLSVHQSGKGVELVADRPTVGAADLCFRWSGDIESAVALLQGDAASPSSRARRHIARRMACRAGRCTSTTPTATCSS